MAEDPWHQSALCAQVDRDLFFLDTGNNGTRAKSICQQCEVRFQCLVEDITFDYPGGGIFGGFGPAARVRMHDKVAGGADPYEVALQAMERQRPIKKAS